MVAEGTSMWWLGDGRKRKYGSKREDGGNKTLADLNFCTIHIGSFFLSWVNGEVLLFFLRER